LKPNGHLFFTVPFGIIGLNIPLHKEVVPKSLELHIREFTLFRARAFFSSFGLEVLKERIIINQPFLWHYAVLLGTKGKTEMSNHRTTPSFSFEENATSYRKKTDSHYNLQRRISATVDMDKTEAAIVAIYRCKNSSGFFAGHDYPQFWARDLGFSVESLIKLGLTGLVRKQLAETLRRQSVTGEIPTMFLPFTSYGRMLSRFPRFVDAFRYSGLHARDHIMSFNFRRVHSWTGIDSSILLMIALVKYEELTGDSTLSDGYRQNINRLGNFCLHKQRCNRWLMGGGIWDGMANYADSPTFLNAVLFAYMCKSLNISADVNLDTFWNFNGFYSDTPYSHHFDTLAHSIGLLYDLIPSEHAERILRFMLDKARVHYGFLNIWPPYDYTVCHQHQHIYQNSTIWPVVEARVYHALLKHGFAAEAKRLKVLTERRRGLNEWYSPFDGSPRGSEDQLFSAAGYLRMCAA
jgi:glycogen debranching enzyme